MKNTEIWPWSEEHILRKDNPVHLGYAGPKVPGDCPGRGLGRGLDPGGRPERTQTALASSPCGEGNQSFLLDISLMGGSHLLPVAAGRSSCAFPVAPSATACPQPRLQPRFCWVGHFSGLW